MEFLQSALSFIESAPAYVHAVTTVVTAATAITALTPTRIDDKGVSTTVKVLNVAFKTLNILAGNVGRNRNADDKPARRL